MQIVEAMYCKPCSNCCVGLGQENVYVSYIAVIFLEVLCFIPNLQNINWIWDEYFFLISYLLNTVKKYKHWNDLKKI